MYRYRYKYIYIHIVSILPSLKGEINAFQQISGKGRGLKKFLWRVGLMGKGVVNFWMGFRVFKDSNYKFYFMTLT